MSPRSPAAQTIETHRLHWDGIQIEITHATNWLDSGIDHLEIASILPGRCACSKRFGIGQPFALLSTD